MQYTIYLKRGFPLSDLEDILVKVFQAEKSQVGSLMKQIAFDISHETISLDSNSTFNVELNIHAIDSLASKTKEISNNLLFGIIFEESSEQEVLIGAYSDDPYQWLLLSQSKLFLVEEKVNDYEGITIFPERLELSKKESISFLAKMISLNDEKENKSVYPVLPSSLWNDCRKLTH